MVKKVKNLVNVAKECPLLFFTQGLASFCWYSLGFGVGSFFLSIAATVSCHVSCYVPILLSFHLTMGRKHFQRNNHIILKRKSLCVCLFFGCLHQRLMGIFRNKCLETNLSKKSVKENLSRNLSKQIT